MKKMKTGIISQTAGSLALVALISIAPTNAFSDSPPRLIADCDTVLSENFASAEASIAKARIQLKYADSGAPFDRSINSPLIAGYAELKSRDGRDYSRLDYGEFFGVFTPHSELPPSEEWGSAQESADSLVIQTEGKGEQNEGRLVFAIKRTVHLDKINMRLTYLEFERICGAVSCFGHTWHRRAAVELQCH